MVKIVAVVGGKHSGKTTVIQHLVREFRNRGYKVGSVKEMSNAQWVDIPGKDTWEHGKAGVEIVAGVAINETVLFVKKKLSLDEIESFFKGFDYLFLEGFENEKTVAKIIAAKDSDEVSKFYDSLTIAVSGIIAGSVEEVRKASTIKVPVLNCGTEAEKLADLVEEKAFHQLPNLNHCGECGYSSCGDLAKAIIAGKATLKECPLRTKDDVILEVNGSRVPLKVFPRDFIKNLLKGMISSLKGVEQAEEIKITVKKA